MSEFQLFFSNELQKNANKKTQSAVRKPTVAAFLSEKGCAKELDFGLLKKPCQNEAPMDDILANLRWRFAARA